MIVCEVPVAIVGVGNMSKFGQMLHNEAQELSKTTSNSANMCKKRKVHTVQSVHGARWNNYKWRNGDQEKKLEYIASLGNEKDATANIVGNPPSRQLGIQNSTMFLNLERCFFKIKSKGLLHLQQSISSHKSWGRPCQRTPKIGCFRQTAQFGKTQFRYFVYLCISSISEIFK